MPTSLDSQMVVDIAQVWLSQIAPTELPLFRVVSKEYVKNPEKALSLSNSKDEALGFGTAEAITMLTPVVLTVGTEVVKFLTAELQKSMKEQSASVIQAKLRSMLKMFQPVEKQVGGQAVSLTPAQLAQVREMVLKKAADLKLSEAHTRLLADAVVGSLAA
jgi:hypothetical protein